MNKSVRLVCPNPECINKSPVWRRISALDEHTCKKCGTKLAVPRLHYREAEQNRKAKEDLKRFGL